MKTYKDNIELFMKKEIFTYRSFKHYKMNVMKLKRNYNQKWMNLT